MPNETVSLDITPAGHGDARPADVQTGEFPGKIGAREIAGNWFCCAAFLGCAIFQKVATGDDALMHKGVCCCLGITCPFQEPRVRKGSTNGFVKADGSDPENIDMHHSPGCVCNGVSCSIKFC